MKKRKLAFAICLALAVTAGCGKNDSDALDTKTTEVSQGEDEKEKTSEVTSELPSEVVEDTSAYPEIATDAEVKTYDSVAVVGDAGYELYTYKEASAKDYADAVNKLAGSLSGKADVYDMVIPLGSGIVYPDNLDKLDNSSNQREAMKSIQGMVGTDVKSVDIYENLMNHRNEYIYFRTDHHWTALGAYYAYQKFCETKGIEAEAIDSYQTKEFDGFVGSFYNDTDCEALKANPDTITAYVPNTTNSSIEVTPDKGDPYTWQIIFDVSGYAAGIKYSTFIAGDNPYTEITNDDVTDGSSCVIIKESFGNAFVPFLVDHYNKIYVVDYRYYTGSFSNLIEEKGVNDVILLNNLSMIRNTYLVGQLQTVLSN